MKLVLPEHCVGKSIEHTKIKKVSMHTAPQKILINADNEIRRRLKRCAQGRRQHKKHTLVHTPTFYGWDK